MNTKDLVAVTSRSFSKNKTLVNRLKESYSKIKLNSDGLSLKGDELISFLKDADKIIIGLEKIDKTVLDNLPKLKLISKYGVGLNNINLEDVKEKNIKLSFTPGVNKQSVAELALMHILVSLRKTHMSLEDIKSGIWTQEKGNELYKKTVGILGYGNIGRELRKMLKPFDNEVIVFDELDVNDKSVTQVTLEEIFSRSDIISIHLPLIESTKNIIDKKLLSIAKKNLKIINTSRGGIINEDDLYNFLNKNSNAFGGLDVFETEPCFSSKLMELKNFNATSHIGSMTNEGVISMGFAAIMGLD